ncbi:MAG: response regulator, partial [Saprospiraceae bacterium]|nr:response regulator [Saprospiraceae bacterium]
LESIIRSSKSLLVILNEILDISKIEAGKMELEHTDLNIERIVEQVVNTLAYRADEKGIELVTECDPALPPVLIGDPVRLQQILLNLTGNAIKFTEKGSVTLIARPESIADGSCRIFFALRDTGIGMSPAQLEVVFESFRQASSDTTRKYGGTGLGLSISKHLVELFGGELRVKSTKGEGSEFSFVIDLPVSANTRIADQEEVSQQMLDALSGTRILIAEDNYYNRIVATETLELRIPGVQIDAAENGQEAVEKCDSGIYDLVLMDVHMPVMDGLEATRRIRETHPELPILALTASVIKAEVQKCLDCGMSGWIPKPFRDIEFFGAIYDVLHNDGTA